MADATSSGRASVISATTRPRRILCRARPAVAPREPSFSVSASRGRVHCRAGTMPNSTAAASAISVVTARTRRSTCIDVHPGTKRAMLAGIEPLSASRLTQAKSTVGGMAASASMPDSIRSSRTTRRRSAPMARRTAISRCRSAPRARSRFTTLVQPMISTKSAAACHRARIGVMPGSSIPSEKV